FVSAPDEVLVVRHSASQPGKFSFDLRLERPERAAVEADGNNGLVLRGRLSDGKGGDNVGFAACVRVLNSGGTVETVDNAVRVTAANEVVILVTSATDIQSFAKRRVEDAVATAHAELERAAT